MLHATCYSKSHDASLHRCCINYQYFSIKETATSKISLTTKKLQHQWHYKVTMRSEFLNSAFPWNVCCCLQNLGKCCTQIWEQMPCKCSIVWFIEIGVNSRPLEVTKLACIRGFNTILYVWSRETYVTKVDSCCKCILEIPWSARGFTRYWRHSDPQGVFLGLDCVPIAS